MPASTPAAVRKQISQGKPDPIYLIVGDDDVEMSQLASDIGALVEEDLRAFNLERLYANDKGVSPFTVAQAARTLALEAWMLGYLARHSALPVPAVLHAEDWLLLMEAMPGRTSP